MSCNFMELANLVCFLNHKYLHALSYNFILIGIYKVIDGK